MTSKHLAIGLAGDHLVALAADPALAARLDGTGAAFAVAGIDRIDGPAPGAATLEPTVAATFLAAHAPATAFLAAAAPHRDHPYNLARRVASLDHLARGRSGLILGPRDSYAPEGEGGNRAWGGAGLTTGAPPGVTATRDAAVAVQKLWQSWPRDSIVADRDSRVFARGDRIVHIDHQGVFGVAGPLTVPSTVQGAPVLAWYAASEEEVGQAGEVADLVVLPDAGPEGVARAAAALDAAASSRFSRDGRRALLFAQVTFAPGTGVAGFAARAGDVAGLPGVDGVLLRPERGTASVVKEIGEVVEEVVPALVARGVVRRAEGATLRERLSLPEPAPLLVGARPAFPAPVPQPPLSFAPSF
ncbi:alkanesulfonate monooxygenase SsuD/methylene tetrahydromethanopterin reductase-like flavin-dependent oxidoreductase (luciferase family) [Thermocatellispora tengchongensis]|uniref:Alkanesulfonate monooxygenase SsuD/methylene tetrahydromethanopterin reductase-like flavin-dependent oxidoreductase (Luciferase family) n=1 Tax=Thermocatellispora tengchongensis TaxID=1073253 RepID=A0A840P109_9ACTN|nr:LLM class flavin-dependent oxidoreductase [Thermocatellispora tengchongensis]MBB5133388.1 alkanesulfonate monooxygenase SsuD/methylene tetrahydromethanopterin reductase-like flavin-dependent oxidoreductase (luciferase family) [Thermocatellispora tengchongensis]